MASNLREELSLANHTGRWCLVTFFRRSNSCSSGRPSSALWGQEVIQQDPALREAGIVQAALEIAWKSWVPLILFSQGGCYITRLSGERRGLGHMEVF